MGRNKKILSILWGAIILIAIFFVYVYIQLPSASNSKSKIVQVSFDDVYLCLKDLKDTLRYTSIFQQPFFELLKELHDDYGAAFSLYVYESADDFVITEVPNKFRTEFMENSEWMKFGYHAIKPHFDEEEQALEFKRSLSTVNNSISYWGGEASLAPCLRLHYYFADSSMIHVLKKHQIYHLLGADDRGRKSYNLNQQQSDSLYNQRTYICDSICYYKTDIRIERMKYFPFELLSLQDKDTIILFTHEWALEGTKNYFNRVKLKQSIKWLNKNNYKFSFLK